MDMSELKRFIDFAFGGSAKDRLIRLGANATFEQLADNGVRAEDIVKLASDLSALGPEAGAGLLRACQSPEVLRRLPVEELVESNPTDRIGREVWAKLDWSKFDSETLEKNREGLLQPYEARAERVVVERLRQVPIAIIGQTVLSETTIHGSRMQSLAKKAEALLTSHGESFVPVDSLLPGWKSTLESRDDSLAGMVFMGSRLGEDWREASRATFKRSFDGSWSTDHPLIRIRMRDVRLPEQEVCGETATRSGNRIVNQRRIRPGNRYKILEVSISGPNYDKRGATMAIRAMLGRSAQINRDAYQNGDQATLLKMLAQDPGAIVKAFFELEPRVFSFGKEGAGGYTYIQPAPGKQYDVELDIPELTATGFPASVSFAWGEHPEGFQYTDAGVQDE